MKDRNFIYFPSFSVGNFANGMKNNFHLKNGMPIKFWDNNFPEKYNHPYFLVTAGHFYKSSNYINDWGFNQDNLLTIGDSGGYQIASGAIKFNTDLKSVIFDWLEHNSKIAMNLDIPPRLKYKGKFNECLEISKENFKYFANRNSGKTEFLTVLQGDDEHSYTKWYKEVKQYEFSGWGVGGCGGSLYRFMSSIMALMQGKEQYKDHNKWLHILGTSKVIDFLILSQLQKSLNEINSNFTVTTDSSTPSRGVVYGLYYYDVDFRNLNFRSLHIPKARAENNKNLTKHTDNNIHDIIFKLPKLIGFDEYLYDGYDYEDIRDWTLEGYSVAILHNFMFFKQTMDLTNKFVYGHPYFLEQVTNSDTFLLLRSIDEMVKAYENNTTPEKVFSKYKNLYTKLSSKEVVSTGNVVHNFFV